MHIISPFPSIQYPRTHCHRSIDAATDLIPPPTGFSPEQHELILNFCRNKLLATMVFCVSQPGVCPAWASRSAYAKCHCMLHSQVSRLKKRQRPAAGVPGFSYGFNKVVTRLIPQYFQGLSHSRGGDPLIIP
ncbi:uncharacterized protein LAJ45_04076 [Morchella importuna]|uniref:uncharacterized protein n=1 Tax=Morchella importuna TaxID=1174673 RepID=UPI001E8D30A1|nr:uncharacterized protein LAJ45_04076 [Morchella importuna]KAH8152082.1 hypothetical protein LAJ45_04076 [Morchella importuna]